MLGPSWIEVTGHDNSAADIMIHNSYILFLSPVQHNACISSSLLNMKKRREGESLAVPPLPPRRLAGPMLVVRGNKIILQNTGCVEERER